MNKGRLVPRSNPITRATINVYQDCGGIEEDAGVEWEGYGHDVKALLAHLTTAMEKIAPNASWKRGPCGTAQVTLGDMTYVASTRKIQLSAKEPSMKLKTEQRLAAAAAAVPIAIFFDLLARGVDSLYGQFFVWLCTLDAS